MKGPARAEGMTHLDPGNKAVEALGLGDLQRINSLEVGKGDQCAPHEGRRDRLREAVPLSQEITAALAA